MLKIDEGEKLELYKDTEGYWTIGVGHLVTMNPSKELAVQILDKTLNRKTNGRITLVESEKLFQEDIQKSISEIKRAGLMDIYTESNECRRAALVNLMFNLGATRLLGFKKALKAWREKNYNLAALEFMNSRWAVQVKFRANRVCSVIQTGTTGLYKIDKY